MAAQGRQSKNASKSRSLGKKWKSINVAEDKIYEFEEGGLISFEELTDYSVVKGEILLGKSEPSEAKRPKTDQDEVDASLTTPSKIKKGKQKKKRKKKKKAQTGEAKLDGPLLESERSCKDATTKGDFAEDDDGEIELSKTNEGSKPQIKCDMSDWNGLGLPDELLAALSDKNFTQPTPIQAETLPVAIFHHQDVIGAAETGSGKTLAFSLPIITHIMNLKKANEVKKSEVDAEGDVTKPLYAVILTPTRELAMQIYKNIVDVTKYTTIKCAVIVGGLSEQKQERVLCKSPEIVIGTPGRLLNLIKDGKPHLSKLDSVRFLVIDEVDRMLQFGHFKDASEILRLMSVSNKKRQTFLFSATLTLPQYHKKLVGKGLKKGSKESVQMLVDKANINTKAKVIDLSTQHIAAEQIDQKRVICTEEEKDLYLLYTLLCHPGRTLIFVNSINCTKKICNLLAVLGRNPLQLHAGKQQRQRLKALDRFTSTKDAVLVATDVAARGLDIPDVDVVIHYHLPKDPKIYIHRSGRTARAQKNGLSIILEGPEDFREYKKICHMMKLDHDLPSVDIDFSILPDLKKRVSLAVRIEKEEHQQRKVNSNSNWFKRAAESLDIDLEHKQDDDDDGHVSKRSSSNLKALKRELSQLLKLPLVPKGFSGTYITRTGALKTMVHRS
eukprot:gene7267-8078_t